MRWFRSEFKSFTGDFLRTPSVGAPPPAAPVAAAASQVDYFDFLANWAAVTGADGYYLDVSTQSDFSTFVTGFENLDVGSNTSKFVDTLDSNTTYYYRVRAYNANGTSANSNTITTITLAFLLDQVPGSAWAWAMFILSGSYFKANGALVTLRRLNDNAEETFYPIRDDGYALTMSSETSGGLTLAAWVGTESAALKTIHGQDGNGDLAQTLAANQPIIINAGTLVSLNSIAAFEFTTAQNYFLTANISLTINGNGISSFIGLSLDTLPLDSVIYQISQDSNYALSLGTGNIGAGASVATRYRYAAVNYNSGEDATTGYHYISQIGTTTPDVQLYYDGAAGAQAYEARSATTITYKLCLGTTAQGGKVGPSVEWQGKVQAWVGYLGDKSGDLGTIEGFINTQ